MAIQASHNAAAARFEATVEGRLCVADYRLHRGVMTLFHTEVPPALEGRGIASVLVRAALDHARDERLRVRPDCSYVTRWIERHPEYLDLLQGRAPRPPARAAEVLDFWFGTEPGPRDEWFRKDPAFDARIGARFGPAIEDALAGRLEAWALTPEGALARVIVLDQFTRNAFRDSARAFAGDALALAAARAMIERGDDQALPPLQRVFAYLPFEHAEDRAAQAESLRLFAALARAAPALADYEDYARRHAAVVERFGRFPHRNAALGRATTPAEAVFLQQPGSRF